MTNNRQCGFLVILILTLSLVIPPIASLNIVTPKNGFHFNEGSSFDFTIVWMSDTQLYSQKYPFIFKNVTDWIVWKQSELNIPYVIHTGDIVQAFPKLMEWIRASQSMRTLEYNNISYGVLAGNHDNGYSSFHLFYNLFFGKWRFNSKEFYRGSFYGNQDHYDIISINGFSLIIVYLSFGINDNELYWANSVLQQHQDKPAILAVHEYINGGGEYTGQGEEIYNKLVVPNSNVFMVLCGHKHDVELNTKIIDGRTVYEVLANYQDEPNGGNGYLRLLHFSIDDGLIYVKTYSPYLDDYNCHDPEDDEFVLVFNPWLSV
jgi:hypothetical protein